MLLFVFLVLVFYLLLLSYLGAPKKHPAVSIVVLGDAAHSPRMLHHASSFLRHGYRVHLLAYSPSSGTSLPRHLAKDPLFSFRPLPSPISLPSSSSSFLFLLLAPLRFFPPALYLFFSLLALAHMDYILVQTPPLLPALPIIRLASALTNSPLIIDWHNSSSSILSLRFSTNSLLVRFIHSLEKSLARTPGHLHLFVSNAMKQVYNPPRALVLYDRPPEHFSPDLAISDRNQLLKLLNTHEIHPDFQSAPIILTSTSFTPDEDLNLLLSALALYNSASASSSSTLPPLLCIVTGKGPLKSSFQAQLDRLAPTMRKVSIHTTWLSAEDYPRFLASAHLGISLHKSSSGLDLPMKISDFLGSGLPVLALDYPCLHELITPNKNGKVFTDAPGLSNHLSDLFSSSSQTQASTTSTTSSSSISTSYPKIQLLKDQITTTSYNGLEWSRWNQHWDETLKNDVRQHVVPTD